MVISKLMGKDEETKFRLGGCKFYSDCDNCGFEGSCIMDEVPWTPDDLEKAIGILKDCLGKKVNEKRGE